MMAIFSLLKLITTRMFSNKLINQDKESKTEHNRYIKLPKSQNYLVIRIACINL